MRAIVTGGAGFIGSHVVDALVARGDEVAVVDSLVHGSKENVNAGAELHVRDIREPLDDVFDAVRPRGRVPPRGPGRRARLRRASRRGRRGQRRRDDPHPRGRSPPRRAGRLRLDGWRDLRRVRGAGAGGRRARAAVAVRHLEARGGGVPARRTTGSTTRATSPCATGTSTARARIRTARRASSRSSSARSRAASRRRSSATGLQTRDYVYVGDVARATTSTVGQDHGVFNVGTGRETSVVELYELCARVAGSDTPAEHAPARLGELQRSFLDPTRAAQRARVHRHGRSRGRPARDLGVDSEGIARTRAKPSPVDHPLPAPDALIRPWRTAAYVAVAIAAFELLLLLVIGGGKLTGFVADRIQVAAEDQVLTPQTQRAAKPVTRKPASAAVAKRPRAKTVVLVLNGNGRTGAAASAASRVRARGYKIGVVAQRAADRSRAAS